MQILANQAQASSGSWIPTGRLNRLQEFQAVCEGTFGVGGTVTLEIRREPGGTIHTVAGYSVTAQDISIVKFRAAEIRGVVTSGDGTTDINLWIE